MDASANASTPEEFWEFVDRTGDGCWPWTGPLWQNGYGKVRWKKRDLGAHRIALMLDLGGDPLPSELQACHHCDNIICCRGEHLYLGTPADNVRDRVVRGRSVYYKGTQLSQAKFTAEQVREIRRRNKAGETQRTLAVEFLASQFAIWRVCTGRSYRDVE